MKKGYLKKFSGLSVGVKASLAYFVANMLNKAIAYLTTPLYTNMMTSEEYGQVSVFLTWLSLIGIVAMFSLQAGVFNNGMMEYKNDRDSFSFSLLILSNVITLVVAAVLFGGYKYTGQFIKVDMTLLALMITIFLFQPAYNFWITSQRFQYKYKASTIVMIIMNILSPTIAVLCIKFAGAGNKVYARLFGAEIVFLIVYIFFYMRAAVKARGKIKFSYWKFALLFNLPLIPHYLSQYLMNSSDKLMISNLLGDSEAAYYSVAYSVAAVVSIVWTSVNASLVPFTYQKCEKKEYKSISEVVTPLWIIFALICLVLIIFAPELVAIMAPDEYSIGKYVIPPVVGGVFFQSMYYSFANVNYYYKKTKYVMYASLTAALVNIVLNYLFIPKFGFIAAGYTTLVSYVIQATIDYYAMKRVVSEEIFSLKNIVCLSVIVVVSTGIFPLLYNGYIVRYGIFVVSLSVAVIYRQRLKEYISEIMKKFIVKKGN